MVVVYLKLKSSVLNHSDMDDLRAKAKEAVESGQYNKVMYITDGVFSMDGDVAKLIPEIVEIAEEFGLITYVDDAHGSGKRVKVQVRLNILAYKIKLISKSVHFLKLSV